MSTVTDTEMDSDMELPASEVVGAGVVESSWRVWGCHAWPSLDRQQRDVDLVGVMAWAWLGHWVRLKLLVHGERVGVHELRAGVAGRGEARRVMSKLCRWADCRGVVLELTPTDEFGADLARLTRLFVSLGFVPNIVAATSFRWRGGMVRRAVACRRHRLS